VEALAVEGEGLGRSGGGLTSKIHLAVDGRGLPMSILVTPGQAGDNPELLPLLDQVSVRPAWGGRPPAFDQDIYKKRNVVERCFNRLKQFRGLATRYAKRVAYYRAEVVIATIALWLRDSQDRP
jgi:transposase